MPVWLLDVDAFMTLYPGLTPADVLGMDLDAFEWLPVIRSARAQAAEWQQTAKPGPLVIGRGSGG